MDIEIIENQMKQELLEKKIDIRKLLDLHAEVKSSLPEKVSKTGDIAKVWAQTGKFMKQMQRYETYEICMFMAHLYDRKNYAYVDFLIEAYCHNGKFQAAIDFLPTLYQLAEKDQISTFWDRLISILPTDRILAYLHSSMPAPLEGIISEFNLDDEQHMTWMMLGYSLKALDSPVLANQALDNALALKYFD